MNTFNVDRSLLNPKFDGYKLQPIPQEQAVLRFQLSNKPTQSTASSKSPLSFQEMRSRITHNHLTVDPESKRAMYVDEDYNVCLMDIPVTGDTRTTPTFRVIYQMAQPMDTSSEVNVQREYPSSVFLSSSTVMVADGNGLLYILPIKDDETEMTEPVGIFSLRTGGSIDAPFRLHYVHRPSPTTIVVLLSSKYYPEGATAATTTSASSRSIQFDLWTCKIDLFSLKSGSATRNLDIVWHRRGTDVPLYTCFVDSIQSYLVIAGSSYPPPDVSINKHYEPTPDEIAPIPRADENLDAAPTATTDSSNPRPPPYSWTQTSDSVTVAFPLPSTTPKNKIKVLFTTQTLTLHVDSYPLSSSDDTSAPGSAPAIKLPHYSAKALWANVNTSSCFWTWDREGEHTYGLLTLHMEKRHEDTRWPQVFADQPTPDDPEVPETLDPSELYLIRESLEKCTAALKTGEDASGLGLGRGMPSLAEGEMDEEVDDAIGRTAWVNWIDSNGGVPSWSPAAKNNKAGQWEEEPVKILSTPLPGSLVKSDDVSLVLKQDLDGTLFELDTGFKQGSDSASLKNPEWKHTNTYSALSFVLASKQDTRFTYHIPGYGVLAMEGGSIRDRGCNLYIYRAPKNPGTKNKHEKQSILGIVDGSGGALLGAGCVRGLSGEPIIVCLTERDLVLIKCL
ncbi:hypothetical protein CVT24_001563 [Panaeolus cyanescens]|uniref:NudC domain-containing protein 1 n=1 Tax=Panaeolus cyanescens TaxID=181874 RepID=A0A409YFF4_9AGAR|nr:hypothetical protein CVT24_001563 [Panaeolus cyanescens]